MVIPRHKWFKQDLTHSTTYLRLENKLKEQSIAHYILHFFFKFRDIKRDLNDKWQTYVLGCCLPLIYNRRRRCSGRPTQHKLSQLIFLFSFWWVGGYFTHFISLILKTWDLREKTSANPHAELVASSWDYGTYHIGDQHNVWQKTKGPTKNQTSSSTGW